MKSLADLCCSVIKTMWVDGEIDMDDIGTLPPVLLDIVSIKLSPKEYVLVGPNTFCWPPSPATIMIYKHVQACCKKEAKLYFISLMEEDHSLWVEKLKSLLERDPYVPHAKELRKEQERAFSLMYPSISIHL